ncbi:MAG: TIGR03084 family metal-binding protein [Streptosporangiaceae bacterium]
MPIDIAELIDDLAAETAALRTITDLLPDAAWQQATPAPGWTVSDQISHLAYFDEAAVTAATDPDTFAEVARLAVADGLDPDAIARQYRDLSPAALRDWFARARSRLLAVFAGLDPAQRMPWYGPSMSVASSLTARLMETWAHGQDIADAVGGHREATARLRHVAHIGVLARAYSFAANGIPLPDAPVRVELSGPAGDTWTWGPAEAADRVTGPALDFCLLVTKRRHLDDTAVQASGPAARQWLAIAQSFAGPPGAGRSPGQFAPGGAARG